jgi:hypothetical protein
VRIAEGVEAPDRVPAETSLTGGERTSLVLHLSPDLLGGQDEDGSAPESAQLEDGTRVPAETFRRLACNCSLLAVSEDERGDPLMRNGQEPDYQACVVAMRGVAGTGCRGALTLGQRAAQPESSRGLAEERLVAMPRERLGRGTHPR